MKAMRRILPCFLGVFLFLPAFSQEVVTFAGGRKMLVKGHSRKGDWYELRLEGGRMRVPVSLVVRVESTDRRGAGTTENRSRSASPPPPSPAASPSRNRSTRKGPATAGKTPGRTGSAPTGRPGAARPGGALPAGSSPGRLNRGRTPPPPLRLPPKRGGKPSSAPPDRPPPR